MGGAEAARKLHERFPDARVVISSGYSDDASIADYAARGCDGALAKPCSIEDMARALNGRKNSSVSD